MENFACKFAKNPSELYGDGGRVYCKTWNYVNRIYPLYIYKNILYYDKQSEPERNTSTPRGHPNVFFHIIIILMQIVYRYII